MKYRKKPVVIDAVQFTGDNMEEVDQLLDGQHGFYGPPNPKVVIVTLEGTMLADPGDWIIKGIQGEFYPCKDEIFRATYEPVSDESA